MTEPGAAARRLTSKLGFRFAFLLSIALLPLGIISVMQATAVMREAEARSEAALLGATLRAAANEARLIEEARGTAAALSHVALGLSLDEAACIAAMQDLAADLPHLSLIAYTPLDGKLRCSSRGEPFDFSDIPLFRQIVERPEPQILLNRNGPVSNTAIIGVIHPVFDDAGTYRGVVSLSVPHDALASPVESASSAEDGATRPLALITFDQDGRIVTSSAGLDSANAHLPRDRALAALQTREPIAFTAYSNAGQFRTYSVVPLVPGTLFAMGSWAHEGGTLVRRLANLPPVVFPLLMFVANLAVAWLAAHQLVIRHIRTLRHSISGFASGRRSVGELDFSQAPIEIQEVAEAYERMTDTILHDEAELEDTIHQKEVLLREVHHRVKNNLQLIASIMSMQIRHARSAEARELMRGLQERVMSLATIHRGLYQTSGLTDVRADELFPDIVRQIVALSSGPGRDFEVTTDIDALRMTPDQAVPLALLTTEAVTNAVKYGRAEPGQRPRLAVKLKEDEDGRAVLEVENSLAEGGSSRPEETAGTGLGMQLLSAFATQLGGQLATDRSERAYLLRMTFPLQPLTEGEERHAASSEVA